MISIHGNTQMKVWTAHIQIDTLILYRA